MHGPGNRLTEAYGPQPAMSDASFFGALNVTNKPSLSKKSWAGLRGGLHRWLTDGIQDPSMPFHSETAFRSLLGHEMKRCERSGCLFQVVLIQFSSPDGDATRLASFVTNRVKSALLGTVRETDYIGWYREGYIIGGVLTTFGDCSGEAVLTRLEQRLLLKLRLILSSEEFLSLRLRFYQPEEIARIERRTVSVE